MINNLSKVFLVLILILVKCDDEDLENNINIESISYELTYTNNSVVKVVIKTYDELETDISFQAYLKSENKDKSYLLNCNGNYYDTIECLSEPDIVLDLDDEYYFYFNQTNFKYTFDELDILEDHKRVSLIFKPDILVEEKIYKDHRKIVCNIDSKMVGGGALYLVKRDKKVLENPKDGFNKYIDLNNYIPHAGLLTDRPHCTLEAFQEVIKRGYHIINADIQFTKDKIPVIFHEKDLSEHTNGKGSVSQYTLSYLEQLKFTTKYGVKYDNEKIPTYEELLKLCCEENIILDLDLSHLDYDTYFSGTDEYANIILNITEKNNMLNSVIFNDGGNKNIILKLKSIQPKITVAYANRNKKEDIEQIKNYDQDSRAIISMGGVESGNTISEEAVKYALSLNKKVKVSLVKDFEMAKKYQSWGVNYIGTDTLPPFLVQNELEEPKILRCYPIDDDTSECDIDENIILEDNEIYDIYYSTNIYNISQNIDPEPIGEFMYVDTNLLEEMYYLIHKFDFNAGILKLNISSKLNPGERIYGVVGPDYENVAECYMYDFECQGSSSHLVDCTIFKNQDDKVTFNGKYKVHSLYDYSLNEFEFENQFDDGQEEGYVEYIEKTGTSYLFFIILIIIIIVVAVIYYIKDKTDTYNEITDTDNTYIPDNYLFR